jgi:nitrate reductase gamma subunit
MNFVLFVVFPYLALIAAVAGGIYRYSTDRFSYSSFSSQFLENRALFWGSIPWHYAILAILAAHVLAFAAAPAWAVLIASPARLYVLEVTGIALAVLAGLGIFLLILRRLLNPRLRAVTSAPDWLLLGALLLQVVLGFSVALFYRWGSDWYLYTVVPWLLSLGKLSPNPDPVLALPWMVKLHILWGFFILALFPFTRLVHLIAFPFWYLWRPYQVVVWNRRFPAKRA